MKKLFTIFSFFFFLFSLSGAHAYTQTDVSNANYLSSKNIITQQSTATGYRLDDSITRAEVAGIALKLRGTTLPEGYICKKYFSDTILNDWICRAVELAADAGLVSRTNMKFRPQDRITRAEGLSILYKASGGKSDITFRSEFREFYYDAEKNNHALQILLSPESGIWEDGGSGYYTFDRELRDEDLSDWQKQLYHTLIAKNLIVRPNKIYYYPFSITTQSEWFASGYVYPNRAILRAEVFGFAKNILGYKATMSGEVTL